MGVFGAFFVLITVILMVVLTRRIRSGEQVYLREIPALSNISSLISQAIEGGKRIHFSLGTRGITDGRTATTLTGLSVLDFLAARGCASGAPPQVTVADPMLLPAAQDTLRRAYTLHQRQKEYMGTQVEMLAPQPEAYALGASTRIHPNETVANVMLGAFGTEALLLAETAAHKGVNQIVGTDDPQAMALLMTTADDRIIGEELYAMSAYLERKPTHLASIRAQDMLRIGIIGLIILGVLARTVGL